MNANPNDDAYYPGPAETLLDIWIVDGDSAYRRAICNGLGKTPDARCTDGFGRSEEALARLAEGKGPHVILMELALPGLSGASAVGQLKARQADLAIVIASACNDAEEIFHAFRAGASGFLSKEASLGRVLAAIREAHAGGAMMPADIAQRVFTFFREDGSAHPPDNLTMREKEVLKVMAASPSREQAALRLNLPADTMGEYVQGICSKMHAHSDVEAVTRAIQEHII